MADTHVETSELNQDSLDGAQASVSEVGSAEEFEKENTNDTPSESHGEAEGDATDGANGEESREAQDAAAPAAEAANGTENGSAGNGEHHVNGNGKANENGEADSTEVDGAANGEKRKSIVEGEAVTISPKKARVESEEAAPEEVAAPTNGHEEAATA